MATLKQGYIKNLSSCCSDAYLLNDNGLYVMLPSTIHVALLVGNGCKDKMYRLVAFDLQAESRAITDWRNPV